MAENVDDSSDDGEFWLWVEVFLAGCLAFLMFDALAVSRGWMSEEPLSWGQAQVALGGVLLVWQGRKAVRAARKIRARRAE